MSVVTAVRLAIRSLARRRAYSVVVILILELIPIFLGLMH